MLTDFKNFLLKGNAVDLAVGFMFGAAFANVVKSFVDNVIMPPVGLIIAKVDFSNLFVALDGKSYASLTELEAAEAPAIKYGQFLTDAISFVILGFIIFMIIKAISKVKKKEEKKSTTPAEEILLLREIRDNLVVKK